MIITLIIPPLARGETCKINDRFGVFVDCKVYTLRYNDNMKKNHRQKRPDIGEGHCEMADYLASVLNQQTIGAKFRGVDIFRDLVEKAWKKETGLPLPPGLPHKKFYKIDF
jgi:hypothetical protein